MKISSTFFYVFLILKNPDFTCDIIQGYGRATQFDSCEIPIPCCLHIRFDFFAQWFTYQK